MSRFWAVPVVFLGSLVFTLIWDIVDGADDVPPWVDDVGCD